MKIGPVMGLRSFRIWVYKFLICVDVEDKVGGLREGIGRCGGDKWGPAGQNVKILNEIRYYWARKSYRSLSSTLYPHNPTPRNPSKRNFRYVRDQFQTSSFQVGFSTGTCGFSRCVTEYGPLGLKANVSRTNQVGYMRGSM